MWGSLRIVTETGGDSFMHLMIVAPPLCCNFSREITLERLAHFVVQLPQKFRAEKSFFGC